MKNEKSADILKRIIVLAIGCQVVLTGFIYFFTKRLIYSIILFSAAIISIAGFLLMIKLIDRIFNRGKGQGLFFLAELLKMALIAAVFYPVSRISETAVLIYILGLSLIVIAIMIEGLFQLLRGFSSDRA